MKKPRTAGAAGQRKQVRIYSRDGHDWSERLPELPDMPTLILAQFAYVLCLVFPSSHARQSACDNSWLDVLAASVQCQRARWIATLRATR